MTETDQPISYGAWVETPVRNTPIDIAAGLLFSYPQSTLVVLNGTTEDAYALIDNGKGVWARDNIKLRSRIVSTALARAHSEDDDKAAKRLQRQSGTTRFQNDVMAQIGPAWDYCNSIGSVPGGACCQHSELNNDGRYLGCASGVIDINSGQLLEPAAARKCLVSASVAAAYEPDTTHPVVEQWLSNIPDNARELLQDALGYALRRKPGRRFYVLWGAPASGKTALAEILRTVMPELSGALHADAMTAGTTSSGLSPECEAVVGGRAFAFVDEVLSGQRVNSNRIKELTGQGTLAWRPLYGQMRSDRITATLFATSNRFPSVDMADAAVIDRLVPVRLESIPVERRINDLVTRIADDPGARSAVLNWLLKGAVKNQQLPAKPDWIAAEIENARSHGMGSTAYWISNNIAVDGSGNSFLPTADIWSALTDGVDSADKTDDGHSRDVVMKMVKRALNLGNTERRSVNGRVSRGWPGIALVFQGDVPEDEAIEIPF